EDAFMGRDRIFRRMASELMAAEREMKGIAQRYRHRFQKMAQHPVAAGERHGLMEADIPLMIALRGPGAGDPLGAERGRLDLEGLSHLDEVEQALGVMAHGRGQKIPEGGAVGL